MECQFYKSICVSVYFSKRPSCRLSNSIILWQQSIQTPSPGIEPIVTNVCAPGISVKERADHANEDTDTLRGHMQFISSKKQDKSDGSRRTDTQNAQRQKANDTQLALEQRKSNVDK